MLIGCILPSHHIFFLIVCGSFFKNNLLSRGTTLNVKIEGKREGVLTSHTLGVRIREEGGAEECEGHMCSWMECAHFQ